MLVLTRKPREAILIGPDIELRVVAVRGRRVRLAIDAPAHIKVKRKELGPVRAASDDTADDSLPHQQKETCHACPS